MEGPPCDVCMSRCRALQGGTLANRLQKAANRGGPRRLPEDNVATLAWYALRTLAGVHALGLAHRDLKPANMGWRGGTAWTASA